MSVLYYQTNEFQLEFNWILGNFSTFFNAASHEVLHVRTYLPVEDIKGSTELGLNPE